MKLVIVESPAKAKTIEGYLGSDFKVMSSVGHIMELATTGPGGLGVDVENDFLPTYKPVKGKTKLVNELKKISKQADFVYIATDLDREGEAIANHLADLLALDKNNNNRIIFSEITKKEILSGIENPQKINQNLVHSQETRRIVDRIMGFKLSKLLQQKIKTKSAGRVQSVALKMIVDRENEINNFISEKYYKLNANYQDYVFEYKDNNKNLDKKTVEQLMEKINDDKLIVTTIEKKKKNEKAKEPYITSTLQQDGVNRLNFSAKKTMMIAQKLYEGIEINGKAQGLITYMRTDSKRLSDDFIKKTTSYIEKEYGKEYCGKYSLKKTKKNVQDAHEAIRPVDINLVPEKIKQFLTEEEYKVYELIYKRTLASLFADAQIEQNKIILSINNVEFKYTFSTDLFDGYKKITPIKTEKKILNVKKGEELTPTTFEVTEHETQPKPRYTEAKLIKALEENGVGRPSTYATIIDTLLTRDYVIKEQKVLKPTSDGELVTIKLHEFFADIINEEYTSKLEEQLDLISDNEVNYLNVLNEFYQKFMNEFEIAQEKMEQVKPTVLERKCPQCGEDLVLRKSRYGEFVGCSNYPECKYMEIEEKVITKCRLCDGDIIEKRTKKNKIFYGCNNFPKCKNAAWKIEDINKEE